MTAQPPAEGDPLVLCVGAGDGRQQEVASGLSRERPRLSVETTTLDSLGETLPGPDCVVTTRVGPDVAAAVRSVQDHDPEVPIVACSDGAGGALLDAGATDVHQVGETPDWGLLARRVERTIDGSPDRDRYARRSLDRIGDGFLAVDGDWRCVYVNDRAAEILGLEPPFEGRALWEALPGAEGRPFYNAARRAMDEQEQVTVRERADDADERWLELRIFPDDHGLSVYVFDVTEQKQRDERLGRLLMTTKALMNPGSRTDIATTVADAVEKVLGYGYARVWLRDEDTGRLEPAAVADDAGVGVGHLDRSLVERAHERSSPVIRDDLEGGLGSALVLPLDEHGALAIGSPDPDALEQSDIAVGEILTANATAALDRAERKEALERYEDVLETVQGMVYALDEEGRFTLVSEPMARRMGYERSDLEGEHVSTILDESGHERGQAVIEGLLHSERDSDTYQTEMVTADGDRVPIEVEISLLPSEDGSFAGTVGAIRDRTELERTRAQLETERDRFAYLFENLPDPVAELDYTGGRPVVRNVNQAFVDTFGLDPERIIGESLNDYVIPYSETESAVREMDRRLAAGEFVTEEVRRETADGPGDFLVRGIPYRTDEDDTRVFGIFTDITDQKRRQRRLGVLNRVLRHNVRNEMTVIRGHSRMIADRLVGEGKDRDLAEAAVDLAESAATIEELSTEARRVEKVLKETHDGDVDVTEVVDDVAGEYRSEHPDADVCLELPPEERVATTDRIRLAIENVLENAIEHNDDDTPTVRVSTDTDENGRAVVRVEDDGPGIPDYERGVVTGDREVTQLEHGSGLGLWIVKWTVEGFGGHVRFGESDLGGSVVQIHLPRPEDDEPGADEAAEHA